MLLSFARSKPFVLAIEGCNPESTSAPESFSVQLLHRLSGSPVEGLALDKKLAETDSEAWCGVQVIDLNTGACVHWFRIDGPVGELYDVGVVPDVVRPMSLSFASDDILRLTTHDPLEEGGTSG
jgi:hypothetical protein